MRIKLSFFLMLFSGAAACAQTQTQPPPRVPKLPAYVRRFSVGPTLTVLGLQAVPERNLNTTTTSPAVDAQYTTTPASQRIGFGLTVQLAVSQRFAINGGGYLRRIGYKMTSDIIEGTDDPNTTVDERTHTVKHEDTRSRVFDFPLMIRYYGKDRHESGPRWFVQGGGAVRKVSHVRSAVDQTVNSGTPECCDFTPAHTERRTVYGVIGGVGLQFNDPIGVRVIPEVRYTRWMANTFNTLSSISQRHQVEAMISLTF
jgi:hypothetical protein